MGMDVFGQAPTAPEGEYFRRNVWGWHPLAGLVTTLCPDEASPCHGWHYNDGDGLDAAGAAALAAKLEERRASGEIAAYCTRHDAFLAKKPLVECGFCGGTGRYGDAPVTPPKSGDGAAMSVLAALDAEDGYRSEGGSCPVCDGAGTVKTPESCRVRPIDVDAFIAFLRASGGFKIW